LSSRAQGPFVVVNAAAMPETLIESELFGHKKGAFTGALADRVGLIEQARGGTLFIDEIGELPLAMQAKLLRALQERAVTRVGDAVARPVDFRLVSATHRALEEMVAKGTFREDLYYRIAGAAVRMPALRERDGDVALLATHFRRAFAARHGLADKELTQDALRALARHQWPGNVRELENVIARAFVMAEGSAIQAQDLGLPAAALAGEGAAEAAPPPSAEPDLTLDAARDAWMKAFLTRALKRHNGKRAETARALGVGDRTLFRYLEQYGIRDH
jgi:DNA-binding NtrC family response regulator